MNIAIAASDAQRKKGQGPKTPARSFDMLNVLEMQPPTQGLSAFVREGFNVLTPVQANQILVHGQFEGQRQIMKDHVRVLADIMQRGKWEQKDKIDFANLDGNLILINGYHRMSAQVESGKSILWTIVIHPCETIKDVRELYYKFDTNTKTRGASQILNGINYAEEAGLSKTIAKALYGAIPVIASGFSKAVKDRDIMTTRSTDRRLAMADEYIGAAKLYEKCLGTTSVRVSGKLRSAGVTAVALVTLRYQPSKAVEFWTGVASNDGLRKGDPRLALYNDMLSRSMNVGSQVQSIFAPAYAWNAWYSDRDIKIIKVYARSRASIDGTPYED
jgi:hypothetical protein